jgi:hypothetical protein
MPDNAKEAWNDVAERFASLGRHVADRYRDLDEGMEDDAEERRRRLQEAAHELSEQVSRAFAAVGETFRDEQSKGELKDAVRAVGDAIALSVDETVDAVRRAARSGGSDRHDADDTAA